MQATMEWSNTHLRMFQARGCILGVPGQDFGAVLGGFQGQSSSPAFPDVGVSQHLMERTGA
jgi:hypothetical protein